MLHEATLKSLCKHKKEDCLLLVMQEVLAERERKRATIFSTQLNGEIEDKGKP
jgi:hypothetical protein